MTKERNMATFKVGDRVRLTDDAALRFGRGGQTGTVDSVVADSSSVADAVYIRWADGDRPFYFASRLTLADAPASPRYVVKARDEMAHDEPYLDSCACRVDLARTADRWNAGTDEPDRDILRRSSWTEEFIVVDTHDAWHNQSATPTPPAPVEPSRPSDAAVCAAWEAAARTIESGLAAGGATMSTRSATVRVGSVATALADYQAARSRELKRLAAASAERERLRVVVQCQDGEECP